MSRIARIVAVNYPHHITQRGNYKQIVFEEDEDFVYYLRLTEKYRQKYGLSILSYCLMPNHVHFIVIPENEYALAKTYNVIQMQYAQYINSKRKMTGHLWQGRFYSCVMDKGHLYFAIRYVERNPVRAGLVKEPWEWKWSSALDRVNRRKGIINLRAVSDFIEIDDWEDFLKEEDKKEFLDEIKKNTKTGKPVGEKRFVEEIGRQFGRNLITKRVGRPPKNR